MHSHVLYSSHAAHTQLPNNLHLWERDQQQHRDFLHQWTMWSTTANQALSKIGQQSCFDTKYEHCASQKQGITKHTWHTVEPIEKRTARINGAKLDGTAA